MQDQHLDDGPLVWLRRIRLASQKSMDFWARSFCISGAQAMAIAALRKDDGLEQRVLHEQLGVTSPTLTGVIDGLVRLGYVERRLHPGDARVKQLFLTVEGLKLSDRIHEKIALYQSYLLDDFTPEEIAQLHSLLRRITLKLEATPTLQ